MSEVQVPQVHGELPPQPQDTPQAPVAPLTQEGNEAPQEPTPEQAQEEQTQEQAEEQQREAELPEWAQKERSALRKEAARYRSERNDLRDQVGEMQKQLASAKTQADIDAAISEWQSKVAEYEARQQRASDLEKALEGAQLDSKWGKFLTGNTLDELQASAAELATELASTGAVLSGGLNPMEQGGADDVAKAVRRLRPTSILR